MKTRLYYLGVLLCLIFATQHSFAQSHADKIDALIKQYNEYEQFNGSVLIAENGKVILKKGYGWANMEWEIPNMPDTKFRLGSITKQFTAMLILQLAESGKIKLDGKITDYLPDYPKAGGDRVTIHHLLSHTSGIPNYTDLSIFRKNKRAFMTPVDIIKMFSDSALQFEPGSHFNYSNSGYILLGAVIEKVTGKPYEMVLTENILIPAGMKNTGYDHSESILKKRAAGYEHNLANYQNSDFIDMSIPYAAGSLYSTVEDLYLWDQILYSEKLLSNKYKDLFFKGNIRDYGTLKYAYGWSVGKVPVGNTTDSVMVITHGGGIDGFNTLILRIPSGKHLVVLLNNTGGTRLNEISRAVRSILYDKSFDKPKQSIASNLFKTITASGIEDAVKSFRDMKNKKEQYFVDENEMNGLGYAYMGQGKLKEAIGIFELNVESFPESWNVYDSLGEAYLNNGDKDQAAKNYRKSVELNPQNIDGLEVLKKLKEK